MGLTAIIATAPEAVGDSDLNDSARAESHMAMPAPLYQLTDNPLSAAAKARHGALSTTALSTGRGCHMGVGPPPDCVTSAGEVWFRDAATCAFSRRTAPSEQSPPAANTLAGPESTALSAAGALTTWGGQMCPMACLTRCPPATSVRAVCAPTAQSNAGGGHRFARVDPPEGAFSAVSVGSRHACGLRGDGTIQCWSVDP